MSITVIYSRPFMFVKFLFCSIRLVLLALRTCSLRADSLVRLLDRWYFEFFLVNNLFSIATSFLCGSLALSICYTLCRFSCFYMCVLHLSPVCEPNRTHLHLCVGVVCANLPVLVCFLRYIGSRQWVFKCLDMLCIASIRRQVILASPIRQVLLVCLFPPIVFR